MAAVSRNCLSLWLCAVSVMSYGLMERDAAEAAPQAGVPKADDASGPQTFGADVNPTGTPIGGSDGYARTVDGGDVTVRTAKQLRSALAKARSGQVVYVEDDAEIELTGETIVIPGGVTLASGRGRDGSSGALLYTTPEKLMRRMFSTGGPQVRITGLRLRGGFATYDKTMPKSSGISASHPNVEIDNCEIYQFNDVAIGAGSGCGVGTERLHVHHNFIHHNQRTGSGYGVNVSGGDPLIEANIFNHCRHHIAGNSRLTSYEARYNIGLDGARIYHNYDVHGAVDSEKNVRGGNWFFDEGEGTTTRDNSIGRLHDGDNDGELTNMSAATAWVTGRYGGALRFDGVDDYVDVVGTPESIVHLRPAKGTITLWMKAEDEEGRGVVCLFQDDQNHVSMERTAAGAIRVQVVENGDSRIDVVTTGAIPRGEFHHVAVTQDGSGVKIYLDGEVSSLEGTNDSLWAGHLTSVRGWIGRGARSYFNGVLDEVYMYKQAMSEATIDRQVQGFAEMAGRWIRIYSNTFHSDVHPIIAVRGDPLEKAEIHHNWFVNGERGRAVDQWNGRKNVEMYGNAYGKTNPTVVTQETPRQIRR